MSSIAWVDLQGVANMRDVGGLPTEDGGQIQPGRLLRSDNLQSLTTEDIERLADLGVTDVVDLRSHVELDAEGPGPLREVETVVHHHHTLFLEDREVSAEDALVLPWNRDDSSDPADGSGDGDGTGPSDSGGTGNDDDSDDDGHGYWTSHYLGYLANRPDSVVAALRAVAYADGATIVHCAAGKDRTGTVVGLALAVAGVSQEHIVADYAVTAERLQRIIDRLMASDHYRQGLIRRTLDEQMPRPEVMRRLLETLDETYGGPLAWLERQGWTEQDTAALRSKLLDA